MKFYTSVDVIGKNICVRGFENGARFSRREYFEPSLFLNIDVPTGYKSLDGKNLERITKPIYEYRNYVRDYNDSGLDLHGTINPEYQYIQENYGIKSDYDIDKLRIANIDIETEVDDTGFPVPELAAQGITAITVLIRGDRKYSFGCGDFRPKLATDYYFKFKNEEEMLEGFLKWWSSDYPDIVTGWNIQYFDVPYLYNRISKIFSDKVANKLSPWKKAWVKQEKDGYNNVRQYIKIYGLQQLDLLSIYKKNVLDPRDNYKLDTIAEVELGRKKVDYSEYGSLHKMYMVDFQKYMEYNQEDVQLVEDIDEVQNLIDFTIMMAFNFGVNFEDVSSQVRCWDVLIYNTLMEDKVVIPPKRQNTFIRKYAGGFVKDPIVGFHDWVCSFDLNSLYPSIIQQLNISPETMREFHTGYSGEDGVDKFIKGDIPKDLLSKNLSMSPNGQTFTKQFEGFLPRILKTLGDERKIYKKEMFKYEELSLNPNITEEERKRYKALETKYNTMQKAVKVAMNSAYGALGNVWGRYYSLEMAEGITLFGQLVLKRSMIAINKKLNEVFKTNGVDYVAASDTDSHYLKLDKLIEKLPPTENKAELVDILDSFCKKFVEPCFEQVFEDIFNDTNSYKNMMVMEREIIAERGIWTGKKRYILNVWDKEGVRYDKPKQKIMGLEPIRSTTPKLCRDKLKEALVIMLEKDNAALIDFISEFKKEFSESEISDISENMGVNGVRKNYDPKIRYGKGTPHHVKAVIGYNEKLKELNLSGEYEQIKDGSKIKLLLLKKPNPMGEDKVAFINTIPKEFKLEGYIDYVGQFEKTFINPIKAVTDIVGWQTKKINTLDWLTEA